MQSAALLRLKYKSVDLYMVTIHADHILLVHTATQNCNKLDKLLRYAGVML